MNIGNVKVSWLKKNNLNTNEYSDGEVEEELLSIMQSDNPAELREKVLSNNPSWAMLYHLSPIRSNLVNWYPYRTNTTILEVGAGCGAITEALVSTVDTTTKIDALELSERRALINAHRNREAKNLDVIIGNIQSLKNTAKYDYVICVGVLEYSGRYISGDNPFSEFLNMLSILLKPNGKLLLAIENKLGLKYISGSREDHVGKFYESIMSYPQYSGVRTFSKSELTTMTLGAGYESVRYFFPVPDYKLPRAILSEDSLKDKNLAKSIITKLYPSPAPDQHRVYNYSEQLALMSLIDAELYPEFSNSFLIEATKGR